MEPFFRRLLTAVLSLFLIGYVAYQGFQIVYNPIQKETAVEYSVYDTIDTDGITIRNETLVPGGGEGYLYYQTENGGRISKSGVIAQVFASESDALAQKKLNSLDEELQKLTEINSQGTANKANLELITKQLDTTMMELVQDIHHSSLDAATEAEQSLLSLFNKYQITIGKVGNFTDRINALTQERATLASSYQPAVSTIEAPVAGYFVSEVDGWEQTLDYSKALNFTVSDIASAMEMEADPQAGSGYVGKMVGDYEWYLACVVPAAQADSLQLGSELTIKLPFVSDESIPVTVAAVNRDKEGQAAVIFQCSYMSSSLSSIRKEPIQIQKTLYEGIRVPQKAVVFSEDGERGVYAQVGNTAVFKQIEILYSDTDFVICADKGDETPEEGEAPFLQLYDDVIVEGKGLYNGKVIA